jgi:hypothetical protein
MNVGIFSPAGALLGISGGSNSRGYSNSLMTSRLPDGEVAVAGVTGKIDAASARLLRQYIRIRVDFSGIVSANVSAEKWGKRKIHRAFHVESRVKLCSARIKNYSAILGRCVSKIQCGQSVLCPYLLCFDSDSKESVRVTRIARRGIELGWLGVCKCDQRYSKADERECGGQFHGRTSSSSTADWEARIQTGALPAVGWSDLVSHLLLYPFCSRKALNVPTLFLEPQSKPSSPQ